MPVVSPQNDLEPEDRWIEINPNKLDDECERQVKLKITYGKLLAKQRKLLSQKKNELKLLKAEVDKEVRADPAKFGIIGPPRETPIENAVLADTRVQTLLAEEIEEQFWVDIREAEIYALNDRKGMLEKEIDLFLSGYFASPKPGSTHPRKEWDQKKQEANDPILNPPPRKER